MLFIFPQAIREAYSGIGPALRTRKNSGCHVRADVRIFLYLDNAGGHGTDACVDEYVKMLKEKFNLICVHQRPRSPAINMLDLGIWMAFQNVVEKLHFGCMKEPNALARTVNKAWEELEPAKLTNVFNRWKLVLDLIIDDDGGNQKVESKRGKLFRAPSEHDECINDLVDPNREESAADAVDKEDLNAEPGLDEESDAAWEAEARTAGGWAG